MTILRHLNHRLPCDMEMNRGIYKLRAASCSVLLLVLTLALVASSLLVARYAVQASSWWLSLLAVTVCLLGLCTWIQLAAARASRWRVLLARQVALSRARTFRTHLGAGGAGHGAGGIAHISSSALEQLEPLDCELDAQMAYRVPGPPPPPPYAVTDLPPSYCPAAPAAPANTFAHVQPDPAAPPPPPGTEPPPPYAVAIKRDPLVQEGVSVPLPPPSAPSGRRRSEDRASSSINRRPTLWF